MKYVSLFSGIGGFEVGLSSLGAKPVLLCEVDDTAANVLAARFPDVELHRDIQTLTSLPACDLLVAGWPCQDLSQAGRTAGISGKQSSLIDEVFRLIDSSERPPTTILLENVAFSLNLRKGEAIHHVTKALAERGYRWAFRVFDTVYFGLPQRRRRVFICASKVFSPRAVLFDAEVYEPLPTVEASHIGFYWTEGNTGVGWTPNAVPPLKGGSSLSIPSPPAIWDVATDRFFTPGIEDAERLQGFNPGWTLVTSERSAQRKRWKLVGNAVSVPVVSWIAQRMQTTQSELNSISNYSNHRAINAGWGGPGIDPKYLNGMFEGPQDAKNASLAEFGLKTKQHASERAITGFYNRYRKSTLRKNDRFLRALQQYTVST